MQQHWLIRLCRRHDLRHRVRVFVNIPGPIPAQRKHKSIDPQFPANRHFRRDVRIVQIVGIEANHAFDFVIDQNLPD